GDGVPVENLVWRYQVARVSNAGANHDGAREETVVSLRASPTLECAVRRDRRTYVGSSARPRMVRRQQRLRGAAFVPVVQPTDLRHRDDGAVRCRDWPGHGRVLVQREVCARLQVIVDVRAQRAAQSTRIGDDDVIEALAPKGPDQTLRKGVLPR